MHNTVKKIVFVILFFFSNQIWAECLSEDNAVEAGGRVCSDGRGVAITTASEALIPRDWKMRFLEDDVSVQKASWPKGKLWVDTLDLIGRTTNLGFLVDGYKKVVIAMRPNDNVFPGATLINSRIARTSEIYNLPEVYARIDDIERIRREKAARRQATVVPNSQLGSAGVHTARRGYVDVNNALFTTNVVGGDLVDGLRDFFRDRWSYSLVVTKRGFSDRPRIEYDIPLQGTSVEEDATSLQGILNQGSDYSYVFKIYKGNDVVQLEIVCRVCGYE